ncbi:SUR7/PalI family-domain-containing protein [Delphinella strobiligena]|nr:SUR7/PalI family-domain-containing protein [Delphinella strobiligena]
MGKAGRAACIFTPMALTIASLVCIILINLGGISKSSSTLNKLYFFEADLTNFTVSSGSSSELSSVLEAAYDSGDIADIYQIHLWNYCKGNESSTNSSDIKITSCSKRKTDFWFNPLEVWNISSIANETASSVTSNSSSNSEISSLISSLSSNETALEDELLDKSARDALKTYKKVSTWMFVAYFATLWLLLAAVIFGILAIFSRWFSFFTWILSIVATILCFGASITATIMFPILTKALKEALDDYGITFHTGTHTLAVSWLATAFTLLATLFWLFSICCCSGQSNPHHRSNREAPINDFKQGHWGLNKATRGRALEVEKTGGDYERVQSPYVSGSHENDNLPLTHVAAPYGHAEPYNHGEANSYYHQQEASPYEPYRHN